MYICTLYTIPAHSHCHSMGQMEGKTELRDDRLGVKCCEDHVRDSRPTLFAVLVFAVLTICRPENRGKPRKARGKTQFQPNFSLKCGFWYSQIVISQEYNPREQRGKHVHQRSNRLSINDGTQIQTLFGPYPSICHAFIINSLVLSSQNP